MRKEWFQTPSAALFLSLRVFAIADSLPVYYYDSHRYNIQTSLLSALGLSTFKPDTRSQSLLFTKYLVSFLCFVLPKIFVLRVYNRLRSRYSHKEASLYALQQKKPQKLPSNTFQK